MIKYKNKQINKSQIKFSCIFVHICPHNISARFPVVQRFVVEIHAKLRVVHSELGLQEE